MPIIAIFFGMIIRVYHGDHNPPHLHIQYGETNAILDIKTGKILHGKLPTRLEKHLNEWVKIRKTEIMKAWEDAQDMKQPKRVKPIE